MPKNIVKLTIFVSGPSDVESEKASLRPIVAGISERLEKTHSVELRVVSWPDDVRPGVNTDPQAEIRKQLSSNDIYLGILATRFGTSTPDAGSGTEDEFNKAFEQLLSNSHSIRVLFYFKNSKVDPFKIEMDQLQKVREFKDRLKSKGVIYQEFTTTDDFINMSKKHLEDMVIDEWREGQWVAIEGLADNSPSQVPATVAPSSQDSHVQDDTAAVPDAVVDFSDEGVDEDMELLDYVERFHKEIEAMTRTLEQMSKTTNSIGSELGVRTKEVIALQEKYEETKHIGGGRAQQEFATNNRRVVDLSARNLDDFAKDMGPLVDEYRRHGQAVFFYFGRLLRASSKLGNEQSHENHRALELLISNLESARASTSHFQDSVNSIPALTGKFKRAKRNTAAILGELIANMLLTTDEARQTLETSRGFDELNKSPE